MIDRSDGAEVDTLLARVNLVDAEALVVGPDEVLIVKGDFGPDSGLPEALAEMFDQLGIGGRALVFNQPVDKPLEFTKVTQEGAKLQLVNGAGEVVKEF